MRVDEDKGIMNNGPQGPWVLRDPRGPAESVRADLGARKIWDAHTSYQTASIESK